MVESSLTAAFVDVSLGPDSELLGDLGQSLERIGLVESEFFVFDLSSFSLKDLSWLAVGSKIWIWVWTTVGQRRVVEATVCSAVSTEHVGGHFVHSNRPSTIVTMKKVKKGWKLYLSMASASMMFCESHFLKFPVVFSSRPGGLIPRDSYFYYS